MTLKPPEALATIVPVEGGGPAPPSIPGGRRAAVTEGSVSVNVPTRTPPRGCPSTAEVIAGAAVRVVIPGRTVVAAGGALLALLGSVSFGVTLATLVIAAAPDWSGVTTIVTLAVPPGASVPMSLE